MKITPELLIIFEPMSDICPMDNLINLIITLVDTKPNENFNFFLYF